MWLLSTDRAELKYFTAPEDVSGGYAILSHVWDASEQTFQDLRALSARCKWVGANPRHFVGRKIRESCLLAARHGWRWIWIDTCCIDKTSSAELSEAINSMFRYYSLAAVCYAFLRDVPRGDALDAKDSAFRRSRWHARGWTLQELVAPKLLIFVSADWTILGYKAELAGLLESVTRVPTAVLRFEQDLADVSVARRMSWASTRKTTRLEDEAYCLMGVFGINMPTLYGEGQKAFYRLQEEIMKTSVDTSLFAWGTKGPLGAVAEVLSHAAPEQVQHKHFSQETHLLAPAPSFFWGYEDVVFRVVNSIGNLAFRHLSDHKERVKVPTFTTTPYGVRTQVPIVDFSNFSVAILFCTQKSLQIGLALTRCPDAPDSERPLYHCGAQGFRLVTIPSDARPIFIPPDWTTVYLTAQPPFRADPAYAQTSASSGPESSQTVSRALAYTNTTTTAPFRVPPAALSSGGLFCTSSSPAALPFGWSGDPPLALVYESLQGWFDPFHHERSGPVLSVALGVCGAARAHWAVVRVGAGVTRVENGAGGRDVVVAPHADTDARGDGEHACPEDHVETWPGRARKVLMPISDLHDASSQMEVIFKFVPCPMNEEGRTLVMHLEAQRLNETD